MVSFFCSIIGQKDRGWNSGEKNNYVDNVGTKAGINSGRWTFTG